MTKYKIVTVIGARPHFIKVAALIDALADCKWAEHILVHSGQHYDDSLSGQFFKELNLPTAKYNLNIGSQPANRQIADCMAGFDQVLQAENPDLVLVIGDTNTTAAAAIATKKRNIRLGHIEAGLREFDRSVPEEINKLIIDAITDLYFVPTETAIRNLELEGKSGNVFLTGDISLDLLKKLEREVTRPEFVRRFSLEEDYVFLTCHRQINTENKGHLRAILEGVSGLPSQVIFAAHPRTRKAIDHFQISSCLGENVILIDPLGFWDTQQMIRGARMVVTDSGGVIKESYFHRVPSLIIDRQTEWKEVLEEGWSVVVGADREAIIDAFHQFIIPKDHKMSLGDGTAGKLIVQIIQQYLDAEESKDPGTGTTHR